MSIGIRDINDYFKVAMSYPVARLQAVIRNQDQSIPMLAAMAAFEVKGPMEIAAKAQQALAQKSTVNVREKLAQEGEEEKNGMLPDNLMMAMQQQQQGSLPENTGIGQLPAPNMQGMGRANGGIIAFDDGGEVPGYAGENGSFVSSVGDFFGNLMPKEYDDETKQRLNAIDSERRSYAKQLYDIAGPSGRNVKTPEQQAAADKLKARIEQLDKDFMSTKFSKAKTKTEEKPRVSAGANEARISKPYPSDAKPKAVDPTAGQAVTAENANPSFVPTNTLPSAPPLPEGRGTGASETKTGIATLGKEPTLEPYKAQPIKDIGAEINTTFGVDKLTSGANELGGILEKGATDARARFEKRPQQTPYKEYERTLRSEEQNAEQDKKDAFQMALVNAGLGIAAGGSRHALQNIAEGAMVGTKQYMGAMKDLKAAAKERQKAFAMIDEARSAKADRDFDRAEALENSILGHKVKSKELSIDAISKALQITVPQATSIFNKQAELQEQDKRVLFEQRMETDRSNKRNATTLAAYDKMAGNRGGGEYNIAWDNATNANKAAMQANPMLAVEYQKNPQKYQDDFNKLLQQALNKSTTTGGATMPGGGNLKFLGFEKQ